MMKCSSTWALGQMEDNGTLYMAAMKREIAYARSKSVEVRRINDT
eukprot:COSAG02_NODE_8971_length_2378_cov_1.838964_5_plen_45_part_00